MKLLVPLISLAALVSASVDLNGHQAAAAVGARHHAVARHGNLSRSDNSGAASPKHRRAASKSARCAAIKAEQAALSSSSIASVATVSAASVYSVSTASVYSVSAASVYQATHTTHKPAPTPDDSGSGSVYTGDGTFYTPGTNACGGYDAYDSMICAVSFEFFDSFPGATANPNDNPICGKWLTAHYQGKTTRVKVTDKCMGCTIYGSLDFSPDAFAQLADPEIGRIHGMTWSFDD